MTTIVRLVQGSPEWHEHRRKYRNASETPVVLGVSPRQTPYQLWQHKLGLTQPEVTPAMLRGTQLEPAARAAYEVRTGLVMQPLVVIEGEYSSSLDGLTLGGERVLEIKCPVKGRDSTLWKTVEVGRLPEHYQWQVQHQLMVTRADVADVWVFDGNDGVLFPVAPDPTSWPRIHVAWDEFMRYVSEAQAPPLTDRDTRLRDDPEWLSAAESPLHQLDEDVARTQALMVDASHTVLGGFSLRSDVKLVRYPERYVDERGVEMWDSVMTLLDQVEAEPDPCSHAQGTGAPTPREV